MADPQHEPVLDGFDVLTVRTYRAALALAPVALLGCAAGALSPGWYPLAAWATATAASVAAWNIHLYDRRFRWFIPGWAWIGWVIVGASGLSGAAGPVVMDAGFGCHLVALSAIALKERLCFRVPMLGAVPWLLCLGVVTHAAGIAPASALGFGGAALPLLGLAVAKARQPLGFDIGDRSKYQI